MSARIWNKWNLHKLLMGIQNGRINLEINLAVSYKIEHLTQEIPFFYPTNENVHPQNELYMNVQSSIIH